MGHVVEVSGLSATICIFNTNLYVFSYELLNVMLKRGCVCFFHMLSHMYLCMDVTLMLSWLLELSLYFHLFLSFFPLLTFSLSFPGAGVFEHISETWETQHPLILIFQPINCETHAVMIVIKENIPAHLPCSELHHAGLQIPLLMSLLFFLHAVWCLLKATWRPLRLLSLSVVGKMGLDVFLNITYFLSFFSPWLLFCWFGISAADSSPHICLAQVFCQMPSWCNSLAFIWAWDRS